MAGAANVPMVNVKIDGKDLQFPKGTNLLMACLKAENPQADYPDQNTGGEHYVPHFCYHPGLSVSGNCRMCFVKTKQMVKRGDQMVPMEQITTSCTNTVAEGVEVFTKSDDVKKVRAGIMDLELINHPLDCPECDKAGECALQDFAFDHGHAASKFDFEKVKAHIKPLSEKITIWGTRCIQCSRCVRVADEISGTSELCFVGRGDHTVIDIFPGKPINNELSLNTVEVCPVGALKNRDFLYTARVWNLDEMPGVCGLCAKGCAVRVDSLKGDVARVMARENPKVNDFWVCDQARLDFKWVNSPRRIDRPRSPKGELTWDRAYDIAAEALKRAATNPGKAWVLAHASATNEELWLLRKLAKDRLGISNFAVMAEPDKAPLNFPKFKSPADANANRAGANIILGIANAEQSMKAFAEACAAGNVEHVLVWSGLPHGVEKLTEVTRALAQEKVTNIVAVDFQASVLTELAHVSLASTTYVETGGSWINHESLLQAFRAALPYPRAGRIGTEILQELLFRVGETAVELPAAGSTPISGRDESYHGEVVQSGWSGSSTVPVFAGSGEVALATKARKMILGPAAVFDDMAAALPQFAGHSHLALIRAKGAKLL